MAATSAATPSRIHGPPDLPDTPGDTPKKKSTEIANSSPTCSPTQSPFPCLAGTPNPENMRPPSTPQALNDDVIRNLCHEDRLFLEHAINILGDARQITYSSTSKEVLLRFAVDRDFMMITFPQSRPPRWLHASIFSGSQDDFRLSPLNSYPRVIHDAVPLWRNAFSSICASHNNPFSFRMTVLVTSLFSYPLNPKHHETKDHCRPRH